MRLSQRVKRLEQKLVEAPVPDATLSDDDQDCLDIVIILRYLTAGCSPNYHDVEATAAWKRGWELYKKLWPITPAHLDPLHGKRAFAFHQFMELQKREPVAGDILRYADLLAAFNPELEIYEYMFNTLLAEAWHRKITHVSYPLRWEGDVLLARTSQMAWEETCGQKHPRFKWSFIEQYDLGMPKPIVENSRMPNTPAVTFLFDSNGYKLQPLLEDIA